MANFEIDFNPDNILERVRRNSARAADDLRNFTGPHKRIAVFLDRWVKVNFRGEGSNVGGWRGLKGGGRYLKRVGNRPRVFDTSAKILQDTGALRISHIPFANARTAGIGSDLDYSEIHDKGLGVPKRRTLPKLRDVAADIEDIFNQHVEEYEEGFFG